MTKFVKDLHPGDQQNWRHDARVLNPTQLDELVAHICQHVQGKWSYKKIPDHPMLLRGRIPDGDEACYTFFFEEPADIALIRE